MNYNFQQISNILNIPLPKGCKLYGNKSTNSRYFLEIDFTGLKLNKTAVVIMMNPSSTGKSNLFFGINASLINDIDYTTYHVIEKLVGGGLNNMKYDKLVFLNLFPYYSSYPKDISAIKNSNLQAFSSVSSKNIRIINTVLKKNKHADIYCAWGKNKDLKKEIDDVKKLLINNKTMNIYFSPYKKNNKGAFKPFNPFSSLYYVRHASDW